MSGRVRICHDHGKWRSLPKPISELCGITKREVRERVTGEMYGGVGGSARDRGSGGIMITA